MKAIFVDKQAAIIHTEEAMTQTPPFISIAFFGEGHMLVPQDKMLVAKVTIRLFRLLGFNDNKIIYQETFNKEIFDVLRKQQIPFSKDSMPEGGLNKPILTIEKEEK